jgi:two-component system sensor histidine kinase CreC
MKLGLRIFGCYLVIFCVCFAYPVGWVLNSLRTRYLEGVEDPLVDQAHVLAGVVGQMMAAGRFDAQRFQGTFDAIYKRPLDISIYHLTKAFVDVAVYITDKHGRVIFHSREPGQVGADYSNWRDVRLTLEGQYGARTSLADPEDPYSSVLFVAAPIMAKGQISGVLTVAKPTTNINSFIAQAQPRIVKVVVVSVAIAVMLGYLVALWITRPIQRLTDYANAVRDGQPAAFPRLDRTEIGTMGRALQKMQTALEGKAYVERYVQQLTHELKSPLSAIRGSAELLEEKVPEERRRRFLTHIRTEAGRIQDIVDRMLTLAALENNPHLLRTRRIQVADLVNAVIESKRPLLIAKIIEVATDIAGSARVNGDEFWIHQAVANLVQNAIDFSRPGGTITIAARTDGPMLRLSVEDGGTAIPVYAQEKIFEKFYSLKRPDSGRKSTGLGLNLVRQVAVLHNGDIRLHNREGQGVRAVLSLPISGPRRRRPRKPELEEKPT